MRSVHAHRFLRYGADYHRQNKSLCRPAGPKHRDRRQKWGVLRPLLSYSRSLKMGFPPKKVIVNVYGELKGSLCSGISNENVEGEYLHFYCIEDIIND